MMEKYLEDSYLKEYESRVIEVDGNKIVLENTIFYPESGGQACDMGKIVRDDEDFVVSNVKKENGKIVHYVDKEGLNERDEVVCVIDWDRRYKLMKSHTCAHIISAIVHKDTGALITGNSITPEKIRIDFSVQDFNVEVAKRFIEEANKAIKRHLEITSYTISREEMDRKPEMVKLAKGLPSFVKIVRIVKIGDVDEQPDGGTHVKNTKEIGELELIEVDNRGKDNRRMYLKLK